MRVTALAFPRTSSFCGSPRKLVRIVTVTSAPASPPFATVTAVIKLVLFVSRAFADSI